MCERLPDGGGAAHFRRGDALRSGPVEAHVAVVDLRACGRLEGDVLEGVGVQSEIRLFGVVVDDDADRAAHVLEVEGDRPVPGVLSIGPVDACHHQVVVV